MREGDVLFSVGCIMKGYTTKSGAGCCWQPGGCRKHCFAGILLLATVSLLPSDSACLTLPDPQELSSCFPKVPCGGTCQDSGYSGFGLWEWKVVAHTEHAVGTQESVSGKQEIPESWSHLGWKRALRSLNPTMNGTLPSRAKVRLKQLKVSFQRMCVQQSRGNWEREERRMIHKYFITRYRNKVC